MNEHDLQDKKVSSKQEERKRKRIEKMLKEMDKTIVRTFDGNRSLRYLVESVGVKAKVEYWNNVEFVTKRIGEMFQIRKVVHDYGLIFNNGFEIKHVTKKFYGFVTAPVVEKRERK